MYLKCPRCRSFFEMSAESLGKRGRKVRCSVCSKTWQARQRDLKETLPKVEGATADASDNFSASSSAATAQAARTPSRDSLPNPSRAAPQASPASVVPPPPLSATSDIPSPYQESATNRLDALTQHHHNFAPLQFAERSIEQPLNNLLRFAFAWIFWGLFVLAMLYVVRTHPIEVLNRFPNAIHFYERLNMSHPDFAKLLLNGKDYSMTQVSVTSEYRLARDLIVVRVLVGNSTGEEKPMPVLRGAFRDARGIETNYFHFQPKEETLPANSVLEYEAQVTLPQPTSTTLTLTLLSLFEQVLDRGGNRLKVHNTKPPRAPSANEAQTQEQTQEQP